MLSNFHLQNHNTLYDPVECREGNHFRVANINKPHWSNSDVQPNSLLNSNSRYESNNVSRNFLALKQMAEVEETNLKYLGKNSGWSYALNTSETESEESLSDDIDFSALSTCSRSYRAFNYSNNGDPANNSDFATNGDSSTIDDKYSDAVCSDTFPVSWHSDTASNWTSVTQTDDISSTSSWYVDSALISEMSMHNTIQQEQDEYENTIQQQQDEYESIERFVAMQQLPECESLSVLPNSRVYIFPDAAAIYRASMKSLESIENDKKGQKQILLKSSCNMIKMMAEEPNLQFDDNNTPDSETKVIRRHTRLRIRWRQHQDWTEEIADEICDNAPSNDFSLITDEEIEHIRKTAWTPNSTDIPNFDELKMGYGVAWATGKKGCVALTTACENCTDAIKHALSPRHQQKLRLIIMDATDPINFLIYYNKSDMQLRKGEQSRKIGILSAQAVRDGEWSFAKSKILVDDLSRGRHRLSARVVIQGIPSHFFIAMLIAIREMEIYHQVKKIKMGRLKQMEEHELQEQQKRSNQRSNRRSNRRRPMGGGVVLTRSLSIGPIKDELNRKDVTPATTCGSSTCSEEVESQSNASNNGLLMNRKLQDSSSPRSGMRHINHTIMIAPDTTPCLEVIREQTKRQNISPIRRLKRSLSRGFGLMAN